MPPDREIVQINLQPSFGGGEVFTGSLVAALASLGLRTRLYVHRRAAFWRGLALDATLVPVSAVGEIERDLAARSPLVITHTALGEDDARRFASCTTLAGFVHMPLYERLPAGLRHYRRLFCVSEHVIASARSRGLTNVHPEPIYGVADLSPRGSGAGIRVSSRYDWDRRKLRDRLFGVIERGAAPIAARFGRRRFRRRPGLTLAVVSRLTPIKQFPLMFGILAPVIARHPQVSLEIFGAGGWASVRDLRRALAPARSQVRFWGQQSDVAAVYGAVDYVLSGLPEKEALGLNLIEAQCCGTPVLAVNAPPFTETVLDGTTGYLFADPRGDRGASFEFLLGRLAAGAPRPRPLLAEAHLARFSIESLSERMRAALAGLA